MRGREGGRRGGGRREKRGREEGEEREGGGRRGGGRRRGEGKREGGEKRKILRAPLQKGRRETRGREGGGKGAGGGRGLPPCPPPHRYMYISSPTVPCALCTMLENKKKIFSSVKDFEKSHARDFQLFFRQKCQILTLWTHQMLSSDLQLGENDSPYFIIQQRLYFSWRIPIRQSWRFGICPI